jgi:5-methylcytosine-specific restriction endonuclease McrA
MRIRRRINTGRPQRLSEISLLILEMGDSPEEVQKVLQDLAALDWQTLLIYNPDFRLQEYTRVKTHLARARAAGLPATLTLDQWLKTLDDFDDQCAYCRRRPLEALDHFVPISAGGGTTADNCVPACLQCNVGKREYSYSSRTPEFQEVSSRVRAYLAAKAPAA